MSAASVDQWRRVGGVLLAVSGVQFVVAMAVTQLGWTTPYSLLNNQISDLGSAYCGYAYGGSHFACSPWHDVFNASAVLLGLLLISGAYLVRDAFPARRSSRTGLVLLAAVGAGAVGVGLFPWDVNGAAHYLSALVAFAGGDLALISLSVAMTGSGFWQKFRSFTRVAGTVGLVALIVYLALFFGFSYGAIPGTGAVERVALAPLLLWLVVVGSAISRVPGPGSSATESDRAGPKGYRGMAMEGVIARRYARARRSGNQAEVRRADAARWTQGQPEGAAILEIAPGPGDMAIELARVGPFRVTGLDVSRTFVEIARENARAAGVRVDFRLGDASAMDFASGSFDLIVCQAAFKNFSRPVEALEEIHRILRDGGTAIIQDLRKDASDAAIRREVEGMGLGPVGAAVTRRILRRLRNRAYTVEQFREMTARSPFGGGDITTTDIGLEVRLTKRPRIR